MTMAHTIEMMILTRATKDTAAGHAGSQLPNQVEIGATQVGYGSHPFAALNPRMPKMQIPTPRMISSTKYACAKLEPRNRDLRSVRRGWFSCRTIIR